VAANVESDCGTWTFAHHQAHVFEVRDRFLGRVDVRVRHDLQQRRAGAVQIDARVAAATRFVVRVLARVFFKMRADDADALGGGILGGFNVEPAVVAKRQVVLAALIVLRQVRIVVVLAVPFRETGLLAGV